MHVIASILAAAKARSDSGAAPYGDNFKREVECGAQQEVGGTRTLITDIDII